MSTEEDRQIAQTIIQQLGGQRFLVMTGAKNLAYGAKELHFRLPKAKGGINSVVIKLTPMDTYEVKFYKIGRSPSFTVTEVSSHDDVYADNLTAIFESETGLATSLGPWRSSGTVSQKQEPRPPRLTR